jgi:hemerythrin
MRWEEEYSVGIQEIDDQHKKLLDMFIGNWESLRYSLGVGR